MPTSLSSLRSRLEALERRSKMPERFTIRTVVVGREGALKEVRKAYEFDSKGRCRSKIITEHPGPPGYKLPDVFD